MSRLSRRLPRLVFVLAFTANALASRGTWAKAEGPSPAVLRIAVVEFESAASDKELAVLGKGLQSMLTTDLTGVPGVVVVERQQLRAILGELALSRPRGLAAMDPATIAKVGRLAGAARLLGGSFTVAGTKMRLDGRLYDVATGQVLVAASMEGDKDSFFDLEKQLAQKVVAALGVKLAPKERVALARVQTADFEAFRSFSAGLAAFDETRYQDALAALSDATKRDNDFQLAARTLKEYEALIAQVRAKADSIDTAARAVEDEHAHRAAAEVSGHWAPVLERLWQLATAPGDGPAKTRRTAALFLLAAGYDVRGFGLESPRGDLFALRRASEEAEKRYLLEARAAFPTLPPYTLLARRAFSRPRDKEGVEAWVDRTATALADMMAPGRRRDDVVGQLGSHLEDPREPGKNGLFARLQLDARGALAFDEQLMAWGEALDPSKDFRARNTFDLARAYQSSLDLGRSTALWGTAAKSEKDPGRLRTLAQEVEHDKELAEALRQTTGHPLARELLMLKGEQALELLRAFFKNGSPGPDGLRHLAEARRLDPEGFVYLGDVPCWSVHVGHLDDVATGPRGEPRRTEELRYWPSAFAREVSRAREAAPEALVVTGAEPTLDSETRFTLRFAPPADAWNADRTRKAAKPREISGPVEAGVAFGIRHASGTDPTTGFAVLLSANKARLVRLSLDQERANGSGRNFVLSALAEHALPHALNAEAHVTVRLEGTKLTVQVDERPALVFAAPAEREGFQGLFFHQHGYAAVGQLKLKTLPRRAR